VVYYKKIAKATFMTLEQGLLRQMPLIFILYRRHGNEYLPLGWVSVTSVGTAGQLCRQAC
jgi:hypothetical protein